MSCLIACFPAHADEIDEIVVTAVRRAVAEDQLSISLDTVERDQVARNVLLTDALRDAPGVFLQQTTPGQGAAIIRGLKGSSVLHLVDGMRLNNAIFRSAPTQYLALVPVALAFWLATWLPSLGGERVRESDPVVLASYLLAAALFVVVLTVDDLAELVVFLVGVFFVAGSSKDEAGGSLVVHFDELSLISEIIFTGGFESGTTAAWSHTVP